MPSLLKYFVRGLLVVVPAGVTVYVVFLSLTLLDRLLPLGVPGLGLLFTLVLITLVGFLASSVVGKAVVQELEQLFRRLPLVKLLYSSIKDLTGAFVGDKKRFDRPVAVSLGPTMMALGFVTREDLGQLELPGHVAVYFPQSYNFAGNLVLVRSDQVVPLRAPSAELMTFIVSGGVSGCGSEGPGLPGSVPPGGKPFA